MYHIHIMSPVGKCNNYVLDTLKRCRYAVRKTWTYLDSGGNFLFSFLLVVQQKELRKHQQFIFEITNHKHTCPVLIIIFLLKHSNQRFFFCPLFETNIIYSQFPPTTPPQQNFISKTNSRLCVIITTPTKIKELWTFIVCFFRI